METLAIEIAKLHESKTNPRTVFDKTTLTELASSIEATGILNPLIVRKNDDGFEIVSGSRRYKAAKGLGLKTVPCIVRVLSDEEAQEIQIIENLQREGVHPLEESDAYSRLHKRGDSIEQIASKMGKSPAYIQQRLKYVDLIAPVRKMFFAGQIGITHALLVARLQPDQQKECIHSLQRGDSASGLASEIERQFFLKLSEAPFDTKDVNLVPKAGTCLGCPKRTGFNKMLFPDIKDADTCTDPECFDTKTKAFVKIQVGTHPDAPTLSIGEFYGAKGHTAKGLLGWVKVGADDNCPDTKEGVVVEMLQRFTNEKQKAKLGQIIKFCANPKCKTHGEKAQRARSDYDSQSGHSKKAMKARKIELRRRGLVFKELASDQFNLHNTDYRAILDWQIRGLSSDHAKAVCNAMGWEPKPAQFGGKNYGGAIEAQLTKLPADGVYQWMYLLMLAEKDLWFYNSNSTPKAALLDAKAKEAGVPLAEIAKQASEKPKPTKVIEKKKKVAKAS